MPQNPSYYKIGNVEAIDIAEHLPFNLGNVIKYAIRAGRKTEDAISDLEKAEWYIRREIERLKRDSKVCN